MKDHDGYDIILPTEAARRLGVAESTLSKWARQGRVVRRQEAHTYYYREGDIAAVVRPRIGAPPKHGKCVSWRKGKKPEAQEAQQDA